MADSRQMAVFETKLARAAAAVRVAQDEADQLGLRGFADDLTEIYVELAFLMRASLDGRRRWTRTTAAKIVRDSA
jgi:hypothetical protein